MTGITCLEDCFLPLSRRVPPTTRFYRVIGRDGGGKIMAFLTKYRALAQGTGQCIQDGIPNPTEPEIQRFFTGVGAQFTLTPALIARHMTVWLGQLRPVQRQALSSVMDGCLTRLKGQGANENILRNVYIKFMCWFRSPFGQALRGMGQDAPPKILFEGKIGKYEILFLHLLYTAGCDVIYADPCSEDAYRKVDPEGGMSQLIAGEIRTPMPAAPPSAPPRPASVKGDRPSKPAPRTDPPKPQTPAPWAGLESEVELNSWAGDKPLWEAALLSYDARQTGGEARMRTVFSVCLGVDERAAYRSQLFQLKRTLEQGAAKWLLAEQKLPAPTAAETEGFRAVSKDLPRPALIRALCQKLTPACGRVQQLLAQCALEQVLSRSPIEDPVRFYNRAVRLACWLCRYVTQLFEGYRTAYQPVLIYYGPITEGEISLLWALAHTGCDILYFSPDRAAGSVFAAHFLPHHWRETLLPESLEVEPFPQREERLRASTTAYNASRELDTLLYSDTGLFRDRQFTRSQPVTLKTTYDEVGQLWKEEAQYRPSFQARDGVVYVPNLFAKVSGVDKGDLNLYWSHIREMITDSTYLITALPFLQKENRLRPAQTAPYLRDNRLDPKALKGASFYRYTHLPDDKQDYILEKIQALIDYDMILDGGSNLPAVMLAVLMDLDKELLRLLQNFDFTREIPKLLIVDVQETLFTLEECILLAFLNQVGFDIAVFSPTGYRNLEPHLRPDSFEIHTVGSFHFDLTVPDLRRKSSGDWFSRLFGTGR